MIWFPITAMIIFGLGIAIIVRDIVVESRR